MQLRFIVHGLVMLQIAQPYAMIAQPYAMIAQYTRSIKYLCIMGNQS